jgi:hypothetical protein
MPPLAALTTPVVTAAPRFVGVRPSRPHHAAHAFARDSCPPRNGRSTPRGTAYATFPPLLSRSLTTRCLAAASARGRARPTAPGGHRAHQGSVDDVEVSAKGGGRGAVSPRRQRVAQPTARWLHWHQTLGDRDARHRRALSELAAGGCRAETPPPSRCPASNQRRDCSERREPPPSSRPASDQQRDCLRSLRGHPRARRFFLNTAAAPAPLDAANPPEFIVSADFTHPWQALAPDMHSPLSQARTYA